jgi:branched-chain amino acid transport system substrate-binding protein
MSKHIVLKIESGSFATGFQVVLSYFDKGKISRREQDGKLPAAPGLLKAYTDFRQAFFCHENTREFIPVDLFRIVVPLNQVTNPKGIRECALDLNNQFQSWLNKLTPEIKLELIYSLRQPELVQFILKISNSEDSEILEKLPWHTWEFFKTYNISVEITLDRILESPNRNKLGKTVRILAVLGNDIGINVQEDLHILKKIWGAWVTELNKPSREELTTALRQQPWDILFFAGHSGSDKKSGRLYLNNKKDLKENSLKLDEIPRALDKAVESGLKMAIFNSCDGLGLVSPLVNAGIPWVVVMREPVSDAVAHDFLRYFLEAFSQGTPFVQAIREARDQIGEKHGHLPWEWLPVVCQSQSAIPLVWPQWSILLNRHMPWISNHFDRLKTQVNQRAQLGAALLK